MEKNISLHLLCSVIRERRVAMSNARPHQRPNCSTMTTLKEERRVPPLPLWLSPSHG